MEKEKWEPIHKSSEKRNKELKLVAVKIFGGCSSGYRG
jgi:hypothetical protein